MTFSYGSAGANNGNLMSETLLPLNTSQAFTYDAYNRLWGRRLWNQSVPRAERHHPNSSHTVRRGILGEQSY
jgi:hypothetical protein